MSRAEDTRRGSKPARCRRLLAGTSGWSYPDWKGSFYRQSVPQRKFLEYYTTRFPATELNASFYRLPTEKMIAGWLKQGRSVWAFFNNTDGGDAWRDAEKLIELVGKRVPQARQAGG